MKFWKVIRGLNSRPLGRASDSLHCFHLTTHGPCINSTYFLCSVSFNNGQCGLFHHIRVKTQIPWIFPLFLSPPLPLFPAHHSKTGMIFSPELYSPNMRSPCRPSPSIIFSFSPVQFTCLRDWGGTHPCGKRANSLQPALHPQAEPPAGLTGRWVSLDSLEKVRDQSTACEYEGPIDKAVPDGEMDATCCWFWRSWNI